LKQQFLKLHPLKDTPENCNDSKSLDPAVAPNSTSLVFFNVMFWKSDDAIVIPTKDQHGSELNI
jgi:hypothetical protein